MQALNAVPHQQNQIYLTNINIPWRRCGEVTAFTHRLITAVVVMMPSSDLNTDTCHSLANASSTIFHLLVIVFSCLNGLTHFLHNTLDINFFQGNTLNITLLVKVFPLRKRLKTPASGVAKFM